jgi:hypothetical protein
MTSFFSTHQNEIFTLSELLIYGLVLRLFGLSTERAHSQSVPSPVMLKIKQYVLVFERSTKSSQFNIGIQTTPDVVCSPVYERQRLLTSACQR